MRGGNGKRERERERERMFQAGEMICGALYHKKITTIKILSRFVLLLK